MNYLAHIYLSGNHPEVRFGNFIGDTVKGKKYENFPENIRKGILLHREIDSFTDHHVLTKSGKRLLPKHLGLYRGVVIDILNDHFLSKQWEEHHNMPLHLFIGNFEKEFHDLSGVLSPIKRQYFERFLEHKFLYQYNTLEGIESVLHGLTHKIKNRAPLYQAMTDIEKNYTTFEFHFNLFFQELKTFCQHYLAR
jgi:acyl carrier protein phosphodiesterase